MLMIRNAYICAEEPISVRFIQEDTCGYQAVDFPRAFPDRAFSNEMAPSHQATSSLLWERCQRELQLEDLLIYLYLNLQW